VKILVVGSGGREHAIIRALLRSSLATELLCAPGNPGIAADAECLPIEAEAIVEIVSVASERELDLVVVGPEAPLVGGLVDALIAAGIPAFGPVAAAARLEGSKAYAKEVMEAASVPTGGWETVESVEDGLAAVLGYPTVIKFDGLAAGKGVVIAADEAAARAALEQFLVERRFGDGQVVVEEFLEGEELSLLALCDGERAVPMASAQDYKRIFDGDLGPNTGGMGSYCPVPGVDEARVAELSALVHQPIVDHFAAAGTPFHGVLYAGLMMTADGPKVLEYNTRFGDPETQAVLPRLRSDLAELLLAATNLGGLAGRELDWDPRWAVTVVLASAGYPDSPRLGDAISGLAQITDPLELTCAGVANDDGALVTAGGRVLNVTALGETPAAARAAAYAGVELVQFSGKQTRTDIALRAEEAS
jgi:phosphoribosylamine---glycine ligase